MNASISPTPWTHDAAWRLMIAATAPQPPTDLHAQCKAFNDWTALLGLMQRHRVESLGACRLLALRDETLPAVVREALRAVRRRTSIDSLRLAAELLRLLDAFAAADLAVLPFKGTVLALAAYGDLSLRQAGDIDLLIHPASLADADALALSLGYTRVSPEFEPRGAFGARLIKSRHDIEYFHPRRRIRLELHWRWLRNPNWLPLDPGALHARAETLRWHGRNVPLVPREELFIYLCAHGAHHRWSRLSWLNDLRFLLASPQWAPDPQRLAQLAGEGGAQPALSLSLHLLTEVTGAPVPQLDAGVATPGLLDQWRRALATDWMSNELIEFLDEWRLLRNWRARFAGLLWHRLLQASENDIATLPLPPAWHWLYPVLRPALWSWRRLRRSRRQ